MDSKRVKSEIAYFAMGCFWKPQKIFSETPGVEETLVGYMGGKEEKESYSYKEVCEEDTGHAEVVKVIFNPSIIDYETLLDVFWTNHDPTQLNRQGLDYGEQYRSAIFYVDSSQEKKAKKSKEEREKLIGKEKVIVTKIEKAGRFYKAEEFHQNYLEKRGLNNCGI